MLPWGSSKADGHGPGQPALGPTKRAAEVPANLNHPVRLCACTW